jgi:hypothetical protein
LVLVPANDAAWLRDNLPSVVTSDLRETGLLSAECDGTDWRMSFADDVHGACVFGKGSCRVKFTLVPSDAVVLRLLLGAAEDGEVSIGHAGAFLVVRAGIHVAKIREIEGEAITRKEATSHTREVANFEPHDLKESLKVLKRVALAKDADPVRMTLKTGGIVLCAKSSAGSVQDEITAKCRVKISLMYSLISALAALAHDRVVLCVRGENEDVTQITLKCGELYLGMVTATQS